MDRVFDWLSVPLIAARTTPQEKQVIAALKSQRLKDVTEGEFMTICEDGATTAGAALPSAMPTGLMHGVWSFAVSMFGDWGVEDLRLAFQLLAARRLDDYLPKTGKGDADAACYGRFDAAYIGKVMTAYSRCALKIYQKLQDYAPRQTGDLYSTDRERNAAYSRSVIMLGKQAFDECGYTRMSTIDTFFAWVLLKCAGLIAGRPADANDLGRSWQSKDAEIERQLNQCFTRFSAEQIAAAIDTMHERGGIFLKNF